MYHEKTPSLWVKRKKARVFCLGGENQLKGGEILGREKNRGETGGEKEREKTKQKKKKEEKGRQKNKKRRAEEEAIFRLRRPFSVLGNENMKKKE